MLELSALPALFQRVLESVRSKNIAPAQKLALKQNLFRHSIFTQLPHARTFLQLKRHTILNPPTSTENHQYF